MDTGSTVAAATTASQKEIRKERQEEKKKQKEQRKKSLVSSCDAAAVPGKGAPEKIPKGQEKPGGGGGQKPGGGGGQKPGGGGGQKPGGGGAQKPGGGGGQKSEGGGGQKSEGGGRQKPGEGDGKKSGEGGGKIPGGGGQKPAKKGQTQSLKDPQSVKQRSQPPGKQPKTKGSTEVNKKEDIFQAVLLADNFSFSIFGPDSPLRQEGLMTLANRKVIDYTLEALTVSGVQEIFIYCSSEVESIREHIKNSRWSSIPNCCITVIMSEDSMSLGDALRDLDGKGVIKNDFILLSAGVVTNKALKPLLNLHRETIKADKGAVMTLIHRKMQSSHRSRPKHQTTAIVIDSQTRKIISYDAKPTGKKLQIPLESIKDEMDIYMDSVDTGITVCSVSVPPLFSDNFDFTCMNDFIRGIMINEEILGNSIYLHRLESGYASRVVDFDTFQGICCDILQRWTYPLVPDLPFGSNPDETVYSMHKNFVYKAVNVKTAYGSEIGKSVVIGANTVIGKNVKINSSVLGDNCKINEDTTIIESHIGNDVQTGAGSKLTRCVLTDGTILKDSTSFEDKLIINGEVYSIKPPIERVEESESDENSDVDVNDYDSDEEPEVGGLQDEDFNIFSTEVLESLLRAFRQNVAKENLVLEINSSKFAYNMTFKELTIGISKGILNIPPKVHSEFYEQFTPKMQWEKIKETILKLKSILSHYVSTPESQRDLIQSLEEYANDNIYFRPMLMKALHLFYDEDILPEDAILLWHKSPSLYEFGDELRVMVKQLIDWLEASDSESDEE